MKSKLKRSVNGRPMIAEDLRLANLVRERADGGLATTFDAIRAVVADGPDAAHWKPRLATGLYRLSEAGYLVQRIPSGAWVPSETWREALAPAPALPTADVAAVSP